MLQNETKNHRLTDANVFLNALMQNNRRAVVIYREKNCQHNVKLMTTSFFRNSIFLGERAVENEKKNQIMFLFSSSRFVVFVFIVFSAGFFSCCFESVDHTFYSKAAPQKTKCMREEEKKSPNRKT